METTSVSSLQGKRVLVIDDHKNIRVTLRMALEQEGAQVTEAESKSQALTTLTKQQETLRQSEWFDVYLMDIRLGDGSGLELLKVVADFGEASRVIMISGEGTVTEALQAINGGAFDYIEKPFTTERIVVTARRCQDYNAMREKIAKGHEILGAHASILAVNRLIAKIARTNSRVLVIGETGTGKELVARSLHRLSERAERPLVKVNCAAIPRSLIESELFGHEKGSFTGALKTRRGLFEQADGGTLFLDEIGEVSSDVQAKLLRVLETGEIFRVGGEKSIAISVRVIAATNRDLAEMVKSGEFREDLYYRLNVVKIDIPPLRERGQDVGLLAKHFLQIACEEHSLGLRHFSDQALAQLQQHRWPGNIRELKNVVERVAILSETESIDAISDLTPPSYTSAKNPETPAASGGFSFACDSQTWESFHDQVGRAFVSYVLELSKGNVSEAARTLCLERAYLHRLMKKLNVER